MADPHTRRERPDPPSTDTLPTADRDGQPVSSRPIIRSGEPRQSLPELTRKNVEIIAQLEASADAERSTADRLAHAIGRYVGSMPFVYLHVAWFSLWLCWNTLPTVPAAWKFDSFPPTILALLVSLESVFLATFILISQNHEERLSRRRNHLDLQINLLSEQENSQMIKMLIAIAERLQIRLEPGAAEMHVDTRPDEIVAQIQQHIEDGQQRGIANTSNGMDPSVPAENL